MNGNACDSRRHPDARLRGLGMLAALLLAAAQPATSAGPPSNRTYFVIAMGLEERYAWQAGCLSFTRDEVCTSEGDCGSWSRTESGPDGELSFEIRLGDDEPPVRLEGRLRIETRGKREAIGGTARVSVGRDSLTIALSGRSTTPADCRGRLDFWQTASRR